MHRLGLTNRKVDIIQRKQISTQSPKQYICYLFAEEFWSISCFISSNKKHYLMSSEEHFFWQRTAEIKLKLKIKFGHSSQAYRSSLSSSTRHCFGNLLVASTTTWKPLLRCRAWALLNWDGTCPLVSLHLPLQISLSSEEVTVKNLQTPVPSLDISLMDQHCL